MTRAPPAGTLSRDTFSMTLPWTSTLLAGLSSPDTPSKMRTFSKRIRESAAACAPGGDAAWAAGKEWECAEAAPKISNAAVNAIPVLTTMIAPLGKSSALRTETGSGSAAR